MPSADAVCILRQPRPPRVWHAALAGAGLLLGLLSGCGGGNSSETRIIGGDVEAVVDQPQGPNTLEIVVDNGPGPDGGFSIGAANLPYVSVKVCAPGSSTACVTVDHVFLDTGSIGLRLLRSAVAGLALPAVQGGAGGQGRVVECYPFVVGAVWGPVARADVSLGGETAASLPIQLIDDMEPRVAEPSPDCLDAANGQLLASATSLQAKGVLGVGMLSYDCGLACESGDYLGGYTLYYACSNASTCTPLAVPAEEQVANPVSALAVNNNGTILVLPALSATGAPVARGRLVLGIGTQSNNQLPLSATVLHVETDPFSPSYLYLATTVGGKRFPYSYIDSGSNGLFFDDATLAGACLGSGGGGAWFCPATLQPRTAEIRSPSGALAQVEFAIGNADVLFSTANTAFANLGGSAGAANEGAFVWGLPFFYGRAVYTSIWGQALSASGPWYAF